MAGLFNNGFPNAYAPNFVNQLPQQQMLYQPALQQAQPQAQDVGIVWVQGEAGAKAYPVAAGRTLMLMDSEAPVFYMKSTDASGMPAPLRTFDFKERTQVAAATTPIQTQQPEIHLEDYVTKRELEERLSALAATKEADDGKRAKPLI